MPNVRKPIPKTQKQLGIEQNVPTYSQYGDPNSFNPNPTENRALQTSFKGDTVKPFSVGLQDGYYRDQQGKIQAPLIMFKRNSIDKNRQIANKLDANNPQNFSVFAKKYTQRNAYDNFKVLNNRIPQQEYYAVVMPDYLTVTYECIVFTYYVEQLNKIVEAMEYASDAYWGNPQRYQFKAMIDSFGFQTELVNNDERIVRSTFDIKINGYIIPDILQKDITALKKFSNKTKIIFSMEAIDSPAFFEGNVVGDRIVTETASQKETKNRSTAIG